MLKQYEEEVNYKLLSDDEVEEGLYFKMNEKVLLRTDSKTQMEILKEGINNGIETVNEARRKLDLMDMEGGDVLIVNGTYVPLTKVGAAYDKAEEQDTEEDSDPDNPINEPNTEGGENTDQDEQEQETAERMNLTPIRKEGKTMAKKMNFTRRNRAKERLKMSASCR